LRLESTAVVCFVGVTGNPVSACVAIRSVGFGPGGNQDATPRGEGLLYRVEIASVVCFVGVTAIPVCVCVPGSRLRAQMFLRFGGQGNLVPRGEWLMTCNPLGRLQVARLTPAFPFWHCSLGFDWRPANPSGSDFKTPVESTVRLRSPQVGLQKPEMHKAHIRKSSAGNMAQTCLKIYWPLVQVLRREQSTGLFEDWCRRIETNPKQPYAARIRRGAPSG